MKKERYVGKKGRDKRNKERIIKKKAKQIIK